MRTKKIFKRIAKWLGFILLVVIIAHVWAVLYVAPKMVVEVKNPITYRERKIENTYDEIFPNGKPFTIITKDSLKLSGYLTYTDSISAKGTVILIHGIHGNKERYYSLSKYLNKQGYNSFALDLRGHGASGGKYTTYGAKERYDIAKCVDALAEEGLQNIGIWGRSLGGAIALQALELDKRLKFGVIESTFSDLHIVVHDYTIMYVGVDSYSFSDFVLDRAAKLATFNPDIVKPVASCANITQPVYMSHGTADDRIDFKYGKQNFEALASKEKEFEAIPNANHRNVWSIGGEAHWDSIIKFINRTTLPEVQ